MTHRSRVGNLRIPLAVAALLLLASCGPRIHVAPIQRPGEDDFDVITSFQIRDGQALNRQQTPLPAGAYRFGFFVRPRPGSRPLPGAHEKIHPALLRRLALGPSTATEEVVVTFEDTLRIPRFSTFGPRAAMGLTPADTTAMRDSTQTLIRQIRHTRTLELAADSAAMESRFGAVVLDNSFWLTRTMVIRIPRNSVLALATSPGVVYVRPAGPTEPPPGMNSSTLDNPDRVRLWVRADPYYVTQLQRGDLALLDTGVNSDHEMLSNNGQFGVRADAVNLDANGRPRVLDPYADLSPAPGHGTMSAGIINGQKTPADEASHGLTKIMIDSYRIYALSTANSAGQPGLVGGALTHALEQNFLSFGGVITIEAQAEEPHDGGISLAADQAFDGGAVIVAANGNIDRGTPPLQVRAPANARRVLGIGAYSVSFGISAVEQIPGPAGDLRTKPDLQAPTEYETASKGSRTSYSGHGGTSGATAVAGGAAALFRNLLLDRAGTASIDPGYVYAGLIAAADPPVPFDKNVNGAGRLYLPDRCEYWMVKLSLSNDEHIVREFDVSGLPLTRVEAGIWWPERAKWAAAIAPATQGVALDTHSEVALTLNAGDANESPVASSNEKESVFQRVGFQVASPVTSLVVDVHARVVRDGPQTVYLVVVGYGVPTP